MSPPPPPILSVLHRNYRAWGFFGVQLGGLGVLGVLEVLRLSEVGKFGALGFGVLVFGGQGFG